MTDLSILQAQEQRAHERYNEAVAMTNRIPWGAGGEAAATLNEDACRGEWLRARSTRIAVEQAARAARLSAERNAS